MIDSLVYLGIDKTLQLLIAFYSLVLVASEISSKAPS
jgi:hypothetical protein